ncbi:MAG: 2-oxoglutarate dehydrogenase complex dihydrolipoyllysine-residue succinyltransferase [Bacteroidales bacterium]|nr:2-oxoglutarate dehydrogenase complex dihydrolipoyllysine-residue succinyltransferase [Bacteroidales bacterium]
MIIEIKIPAAGESITEVAIGNWLIEDGAFVEKDQEIAEVETDKATLPLIAPEAGIVHIRIPAGEKARIGDVACTLDTNQAVTALAGSAKTPEKPQLTREVPEKPQKKDVPQKRQERDQVRTTPLARNMMNAHNLKVEDIINGLLKISRNDVELVVKSQAPVQTGIPPEVARGRQTERIPMSPLRRKISKRLVAVKNETAMLTTFNEVDMTSVMELRKKYQARFQEKHGIKLGLMSFFIKASTEALKVYPGVGSFIDGDDIIVPRFTDIAVAVQTEKGLMVPVIRDTQVLNLAEIESILTGLADKARKSKLSIEEMTGGTFTITNGGVFGSMLSTPILNPPQSAILGMHNIVERPVVVNGKIEVRPIMYVALSYDHRVIDGRDSVGFLIKIKELIESPAGMGPDASDPFTVLLGL